MSVLPATNSRVAIYARVSTEEQKDGQTIDSQVAELERFAREKSWSIAGIYKDEGWSGSIMARPDLDRLRDDASRGLFGVVLINDVDRLARDVSHLGVIKRDLERHGVDVTFRKLPSEKSPTYNLMVNILGSFAEFEREMISDRTRRGRRHKVEVRKQFLGTNPAYGFRYIPKAGRAGSEGFLELVPHEVEVIRQIYQWVDEEHLSSNRVVERLNALGIRARKGGRWAKSSVRRILRNEMCAGVWYYNKHQGCEPLRTPKATGYRKSLKSSNRLRPRVEWIPVELPKSLHIIARGRWKRVQDQIDRNVVFSPRNEKHQYLLSGLVRCGACTAAYVGDPSHGRSFFYRCSARCKKLPSISESLMDDSVWKATEAAILDPSVISESIAGLRKTIAGKKTQTKNRIHEVETVRLEVRQEEQRLLAAYRTGVISLDQLSQEMASIKAKRLWLERTTNSLAGSTSISAVIVDRSINDYCVEAARRLKTLRDHERREFLRILVRNIVFNGDKVTISCAIPIASGSDPPDTALSSAQRIAAPISDSCGRNPAVETLGFTLEKLIDRVRPEQPRRANGRFYKRQMVRSH